MCADGRPGPALDFQGVGQTQHGGFYFIRGQGGVAQQPALLLRFARVQTAEAGQLHAGSGGLADGFFLGPSGFQQAGDLQPARRQFGGDHRAQILADGVVHDRPASGIQLAHGPDMRVVMAVLHKARQRQLQRLRSVAVHHAARIGKGLYQFGGQHHVPHAQSGVEGLAERADVERALILVQALHARRGLPVVMELAVVVILDDPLAFCAAQLINSRRRSSGNVAPVGYW